MTSNCLSGIRPDSVFTASQLLIVFQMLKSVASQLLIQALCCDLKTVSQAFGQTGALLVLLYWLL